MRGSVFTTSRAATGRLLAEITDDLLPQAEVAEDLDVCVHTLRNWERRGRGPPPIRIGRRVFYRGEAVREWLLQQPACA